MWSDRKQPEDTPRPNPAPSRPDVGASNSEVPAAAAGRTMVADSRGVAVIGKGMVIKGQIKSAEHMHISGEIDGSLNLAGFDLTVTSDARVHADVAAREVDVGGAIEGNVDATRKITVRKGGRLIGDLRTPGIVIEDGAYFKGNIEIVNRDSRDTTGGAATPARTATAAG
ncbi:MAG: polymer-forming cytoskeletal protein [Acidobacteriaceae bacterium]|nr:polymer-forming cytoskeletal protein [Acidobacteriaceae bacterium]